MKLKEMKKATKGWAITTAFLTFVVAILCILLPYFAGDVITAPLNYIIAPYNYLYGVGASIVTTVTNLFTGGGFDPYVLGLLIVVAVFALFLVIWFLTIFFRLRFSTYKAWFAFLIEFAVLIYVATGLVLLNYQDYSQITAIDESFFMALLNHSDFTVKIMAVVEAGLIFFTLIFLLVTFFVDHSRSKKNKNNKKKSQVVSEVNKESTSEKSDEAALALAAAVDEYKKTDEESEQEDKMLVLLEEIRLNSANQLSAEDVRRYARDEYLKLENSGEDTPLEESNNEAVASVGEQILKVLEYLKENGESQSKILDEISKKLSDQPVVVTEYVAPEEPSEPVVEEPDTEEEPVLEETPAFELSSEEKQKIIRIPFQQRMKDADPEMRKHYNELKAEALSYGVNSRISNSGDTFRLHRKTYLKITIAGKSLKLYFALDPNEYANTTLPIQDAGSKGIYAEIPLVFKVKSDLSLRRAKQLIADVMEKDGFEQGKIEEYDWAEEMDKGIAYSD